LLLFGFCDFDDCQCLNGGPERLTTNGTESLAATATGECGNPRRCILTPDGETDSDEAEDVVRLLCSTYLIQMMQKHEYGDGLLSYPHSLCPDLLCARNL
jgi:hypothetical protein